MTAHLRAGGGSQPWALGVGESFISTRVTPDVTGRRFHGCQSHGKSNVWPQSPPLPPPPPGRLSYFEGLIFSALMKVTAVQGWYLGLSVRILMAGAQS